MRELKRSENPTQGTKAFASHQKIIEQKSSEADSENIMTKININYSHFISIQSLITIHACINSNHKVFNDQNTKMTKEHDNDQRLVMPPRTARAKITTQNKINRGPATIMSSTTLSQQPAAPSTPATDRKGKASSRKPFDKINVNTPSRSAVKPVS